MRSRSEFGVRADESDRKELPHERDRSMIEVRHHQVVPSDQNGGGMAVGGNLPKRHRATLAAIFEHPTRSDIEWRSIETLLEALGATISEGRGSRVRVLLNGTRNIFVFHRPHPQKVGGKSAVRSVQVFLANAGVRRP